MISSVLWDISLGIISGVISSVIVSKVFLIYGDNQKQLEILETNINKIDFIHGELSAMKKVTEVFHDQEIDMRGQPTLVMICFCPRSSPTQVRERSYEAKKVSYLPSNTLSLVLAVVDFALPLS